MIYSRRLLIDDCSEEELRTAAEHIKTGALVVLATDTVYGIGCSAFLQAAVTRVFEVKRRASSKQLPVFVAGFKEISSIIPSALHEEVQRLAAAFWPGALTIVTDVMQKTLYTQPRPFGPAESIGFRVPDSPGLLRLLSHGVILAQTSLNESGEPVIDDLTSSRAKEFLEHADLVLDSNRRSLGHPSTVIRVDATGYTILREGSISEEAIRAVLPWEST